MRVKLAAAIAACGLLSLGIAGAVLCENTLRVPRRIASANPAPTVTVRAPDGAGLKAWFLTPPEQQTGCVILLHGIADSRSSGLGLAHFFIENGYAVLLPDSRAHGESGGDLVTYGLFEKDDVLLWAAWLRERGCRELFGLGESMGAAILIQAAAEKPVFKAIVAECPFASLKRIAAERLVQYMGKTAWHFAAPAVVAAASVYARIRYGLDLDSVEPRECIRRVQIPILLIHGLEDHNIDPWHSRVLAAAAPHADLWLVPHAGHTQASSTDPTGFQQRVLAWFQ